jgi:hypothetical protein
LSQDSKKYDFASCRLFLGGSHGLRTKSIHNFPQALGTSAIAKLHLVAGLQGPFCKRLCKISSTNGSDFHTYYSLKLAFQQKRSQLFMDEGNAESFSLKIATLPIRPDILFGFG